MSRDTLFQAEILFQLEERPAKTVSELADRMRAHRSSVSRTLAVLRQNKLVDSEDKGWALTLNGQEKAADFMLVLSRRMQAMTEQANRIAAMFKRVNG